MIAIHNSQSGFHLRWITYCQRNEIPFKLVDCHSNNLIANLKGCKALLWHHHQGSSKDLNIAKPILFALEQAGINVFPNFNTNWHFDDKVGQKYLLEAIGSPLVPSYVFVEKQKALQWINETTFPKVFKLRGGAGAANVRLVHSAIEAKKLIKKAFRKGFSNYDKWSSIRERYRKLRLGKTSFFDLLKGFVRLGYPPPFTKVLGREVGYAYFQDFIANNDYDIRVVVIANKAFAIKRMVRNNDFRASGSGNILYEKQHFNEQDIKLAFEIHAKLKSQCTAMDFVYDNGQPRVVEISYGFSPEGYDPCPGYWDEELNWHEGRFDPYGWMVEEVLKEL
jgi:glutathione synthase/RimK-type ligase-like ATP-grasp enzyme